MANQTVKTNTFLQNTLNAKFLGTDIQPSSFEIGDGTTAPSTGDTSLTRRIPVKNTEQIDDFDATTGWSAGTDSAVSLNTTTFKQGTGSVSLAKSGTSGTSMSMDKTVTSLDFTSKDLWLWVYITDVTELVSSGTALTIRYGSDSSNYYYLDVAIGSLSDGWNYVTFNTSTASGTTGSPTIAACDYLYFAFNVDAAGDTIAADQIMIDDAKLAEEADYTLSFQTGYPVVTAAQYKAETRGRLGTTDANGSLISESGEINADGDLESHSVFDGESKSDTDIFVISEITRIRQQNV